MSLKVKENLGWVVAALLFVCPPARSTAPTLCLWDMYAMAAIASGKYSLDSMDFRKDICNTACSIANEMIKRRSK